MYGLSTLHYTGLFSATLFSGHSYEALNQDSIKRKMFIYNKFGKK